MEYTGTIVLMRRTHYSLSGIGTLDAGCLEMLLILMLMI